ncbi:MAG: Cu(I)/Ag(I) efflux system membrane protein CusB [Comamonadaceae bacterium]|nr:MAG: Cu(I)/Ag(I) efflux system membrane protein CusB [Comamonadaceae bacterium]
MSGKGPVVTVPISAVIDSGTRQVVLIQLKEGRFEPREVKLGARSDTHVEVQSGVKEGEQVVVSANFLIDAESNLKAAIGGFASGPTATATPATQGAGHQAQGVLEEMDSASGTVSLAHGAIPSLKWPAMTMQFKLANAALLKDLKPGVKVAFEFVERAPGEWVITRIQPLDPHAGH